MILDMDMRVLEVNTATEKAVGLKKEEIIGRYCYDIFRCSDHSPQGCPHEKLKVSQNPETMEIEALNGTYLVTVAPIFDEKGRMVETVHIAKDITERKWLEKENLDEKDRLIEEMKRHREYVFEVADRFRNPLQVLQGYLELFDKEDLNQEQKNMLKNIGESARHLEEWVKKLT